MKNILNISAVILLLIVFSLSAQAQVKEENIKVYGNCEMCKERIETALDLKGIKLAEWNAETQMLKIAYRADKIKKEAIYKAVAAVGHDTDEVKADDAKYAALPFCCLYRNGVVEKEGCCEDPNCKKP